MRANNEFVSGNWSEAYQIPLLPMGAGCDLDTSTDSISSINGKISFVPVPIIINL